MALGYRHDSWRPLIQGSEPAVPAHIMSVESLARLSHVRPTGGSPQAASGASGASLTLSQTRSLACRVPGQDQESKGQ